MPPSSPSPGLNLAILAPSSGFSVQNGTPILFQVQASRTLGSLDQSGTRLHALPGTGWTEINPGNPAQWRNLAGDVESYTLYQVTDPEAWNLSACNLYSSMTDNPVAPADDYWVCPLEQFLPSQPGFVPPGPDLSASVEWYSDRDGKIGEGAAISAILSSGPHRITAQLSHGNQATAGTVDVDVIAPTPITPTPDPQPPVSVQPQPQPIVTQPALSLPQVSVNWSWLLLILLLLLILNDKDEHKEEEE